MRHLKLNVLIHRSPRARSAARSLAIAALVSFCLVFAACGGTVTSAPSTELKTNAPRASVTVSASTPAEPITGATRISATAAPISATATLAPTATPTRIPARLSQLMDGGCCVSPAWLSDSSGVLFIDKPTADAPVGMYEVRLDAPNQSALWSERIANYTRELDYAQIPEPTGTRLIRVEDGQEVRIPNGGRSVQLSPDRTRLVWAESRDTFPIENRVTNIMLANLDGSQPQRVTQLLRGGVNGWLDNQHLVLNGRASRDTDNSTLLIYNLADGSKKEIAQAERIRFATPSRDGAWLVYTIVNDPDPERNGVWAARADGTDARKLPVFGAAQWRDNTRLIYVPFEMDKPTHAFIEYDVETGATRRLTPEDQPFKITSGDWAVSPDGEKIVFVNAADNNLWVWWLGE